MESVIPVLSFALTLFLTPFWIKIARERGLVGRDMNKEGEILVPEAGGVVPVITSSLVLVFLSVLYPHYVPEILTASLILLSFLLFGVIDDLLGWKKGFPTFIKPFITIFPSLFVAPLLLVKDYNVFPVPGWFFAFVVAPVGILGAANAFNIFAGLNGLEAGLGVLLLVFLGVKFFLDGQYVPFLLSITVASSLLAFLFFNRYPAKVFPGDSLTYPVGAFFAFLSILGRAEVFALLLFLPYFLDFFLHLRCFLKRGKWPETFGIPKEGKLLPPRTPCSITHLALKVIPSEREAVLLTLLSYFLWGVVAWLVSSVV